MTRSLCFALTQHRPVTSRHGDTISFFVFLFFAWPLISIYLLSFWELSGRWNFFLRTMTTAARGQLAPITSWTFLLRGALVSLSHCQSHSGWFLLTSHVSNTTLPRSQVSVQQLSSTAFFLICWGRRGWSWDNMWPSLLKGFCINRNIHRFKIS